MLSRTQLALEGLGAPPDARVVLYRLNWAVQWTEGARALLVMGRGVETGADSRRVTLDLVAGQPWYGHEPGELAEWVHDRLP